MCVLILSARESCCGWGETEDNSLVGTHNMVLYLRKVTAGFGAQTTEKANISGRDCFFPTLPAPPAGEHRGENKRPTL